MPLQKPKVSVPDTGELTRAIITADEGGAGSVQCLFNPGEYTIAKSNHWEPRRNQSKNVPALEFTGGGGRTLTMELMFDTYEQPKGNDREQAKSASVSDYIQTLWKMTEIDTALKNAKTGQGRPPVVTFQWGSEWSFQAVITSLSVRYTLFRRDGTPVRALANITFQEAQDPKKQKGTNPTSESLPGYARREVRPHDTLALIAYEEYGDPTQWRRIADENHLEDPLDLRPGQTLGIPPL